jgi:hyperosmotically inducible protein
MRAHPLFRVSAAAPLIAVLGFAMPSSAGAADPPADTWLTTRAKVALLTTPGISSSAVHVDTIDGVVTLHGKVQTAAQKARAAAVAKVAGVRKVRNLLQVVPTSDEKFVTVADDEIKDAVSAALKAEKSLDDSSIVVKSVNKGVVLLSGKASGPGDHLEAIECASGVSGVRRVASEVKTAKESAPPVYRQDRVESRGKERTLTESTHDSNLTVAVKMLLIRTPGVPALEVNVDTMHGVVTLFGIVPTAEAKAVAAAEARKVAGVKRVDDELEIVADSRRDVVNAKDDDIQRDVKRELKKHSALKDVDAETKNGVVRLSGTVDSPMHRLTAATIARSVTGVRAVEDGLRSE